VVGHYFLLHFISAWHVKDECVPLAMEEAIRLPLQKVISCD
jgi:hypothetical protein